MAWAACKENGQWSQTGPQKRGGKEEDRAEVGETEYRKRCGRGDWKKENGMTEIYGD